MGEFTVTLQNTAISGQSYRTARFFYFIDPLNDGGDFTQLAQEGIFKDKDGLTGLSASGAPRSLNFLNEYLRHNPQWLSHIYLTTTDAANFNYAMNIVRYSPFVPDDMSVKNINPIAGSNEYREQNAELTVKVNEQLNNEQWLDVRIKNQTTLWLHFFFFPTPSKMQRFESLIRYY